MRVWVDADACPGEIRTILLRSAARGRIAELVFVANAPLSLPRREGVRLELVPPGSDKADDRIAEGCGPGDLVVTADVPLAARVVEAGATGLNPRGEPYTEETVGEALSMRNFFDEMRSGGLVSGGPAGHARADTQRFANALDRFLARGGA